MEQLSEAHRYDLDLVNGTIWLTSHQSLKHGLIFGSGYWDLQDTNQAGRKKSCSGWTHRDSEIIWLKTDPRGPTSWQMAGV